MRSKQILAMILIVVASTSSTYIHTATVVLAVNILLLCTMMQPVQAAKIMTMVHSHTSSQQHYQPASLSGYGLSTTRKFSAHMMVIICAYTCTTYNTVIRCLNFIIIMVQNQVPLSL